MTGIETLLAIEEIKALQARRVRALDSQDWALYRTCHAPDFVSHTFAKQPVGGLDQVMEGLIAAMTGTLSIHHVHSPEIAFSSASEASAIWVLTDRVYWQEGGQEHRMLGWGHYHDSYSRRDGQWLFTSRRITRLRTEVTPGATRYNTIPL